MWLWKQPRQPCIGLALCAVIAILCADRSLFSAGAIVGLFAISAIVWLVWRRALFVWIAIFAAIFLRHQIAVHSDARAISENVGDGSRLVRGVGIVVEEPRELDSFHGIPRSRFCVRLKSVALDAERSCDAIAILYWSGTPPIYGDRISFSGDIKSIPSPRNPGEFDNAAYQRRRGIFSEIHVRYATDGVVLSHGNGNALIAFAQGARRWMQKTLTVDLADSPEIAGLVQSMVLGLKDETPGETRELFQRTGTLHLFVVNGLHVGMFTLIALFLLKPLGMKRRTSFFIIVPLLAFYALVTGLSPGSVRATVMAAILLGGSLAERNPLPFNSLAAAAFAILLWDTNELFMPGFQFSFGVVGTILFLASRIRKRLLPLGLPDPYLPRLLWNPLQLACASAWRRIATLLGVTTAASIGASPFTAGYFHLLAPSSLLANLLVVPLALVLLFEGVFAMLVGFFGNAVSAVFNNINWLFAHGILALVHAFALIPGGHVFLELPKKHATCEITVFDFGAGGSAHVRAGNYDWMIDCGNQLAYENCVREFLRSRGVNRLDGLVLTHGDVAHIGSAPLVFADFSPRDIVDSAVRDRSMNRRAFHALLAANQLGKSICAPGDTLRFAPHVTARVLYPPPGIDARTADDKALVLQLTACKTRVLFMSDSGFFTEQWLLDHERDLRSDILIKGRHATDISGTPDFLNAVNPRAIVCTSTDFPPNEQVPEEWVNDVAARGIALFRQDKTGAVEIAIDRDKWSARAFLTNQRFTSRSE